MSVPMATLAETLDSYHAEPFYNETAGTFSSRGRAALVAECLRKMLATADPKLRDSRFVEVQGKAAGCYVFIPRILHQWHPTPTKVQAEFEDVVRELLKDLS
jgi:hypothetical protein